MAALVATLRRAGWRAPLNNSQNQSGIVLAGMGLCGIGLGLLWAIDQPRPTGRPVAGLADANSLEATDGSALDQTRQYCGPGAPIVRRVKTGSGAQATAVSRPALGDRPVQRRKAREKPERSEKPPDWHAATGVKEESRACEGSSLRPVAACRTIAAMGLPCGAYGLCPPVSRASSPPLTRCTPFMMRRGVHRHDR
jgi:hypothetical protein